MRVDQFLPKLSAGDAISNHALSLRSLLSEMGHTSELFSEQLPVDPVAPVKHFSQYSLESDDEQVLLLHFSAAYPAVVLDWLEQLPVRKVLVYHNITPHTYFTGINPVYEARSKAGREQLSQLLPSLVGEAWGVSAYNCQELKSCGWSDPQVLPIVFEPRDYALRPDRDVLRRCQEKTNILFVGRVAPNKHLEDLILTFYYFKKYVRPNAHLRLVGSSGGMDKYLAYLQALVERLDLHNVDFAGHVSNAALLAYYQSANLYLSMSEHEGFGVPFLECMHFRVPIVAYKAAAVAETLGQSGVLITQKLYPAVAELIGLVLDADTLRERIIAQQHEHLHNFSPEVVRRKLESLL
ncbi:MAG: glycosyltransferase [Anaerolineae bacterium]|nr:glycosyltransferase [Anaerolineae bacterium]